MQTRLWPGVYSIKPPGLTFYLIDKIRTLRFRVSIGGMIWPIRRYRLIFKIAIFDHETWPLAKVPEVAHVLSFYPRGEIELIFALRGAVSETWADFQNCHIWAWNFTIRQSSRSCTYTLFLPMGVKIELIFALRAAVSKIWADFLNCNIHDIWAWNLDIGQSARSCTYTLFLPQWGEIELIFALWATVSEIRADF